MATIWFSDGAAQLLAGHTKLESTVRHRGVEVDDALSISEQIVNLWRDHVLAARPRQYFAHGWIQSGWADGLCGRKTTAGLMEAIGSKAVGENALSKLDKARSKLRLTRPTYPFRFPLAM